jgi:hypothetical protein
MKTRIASSMLVAVAAVTIFSAQLAQAGHIVDIDATTLGVADGTVIGSIANPGSAGVFTTVTGTVVAASHAPNQGGTPIQGLGFGGSKMQSAITPGSLGLTGNATHSVRAWVFNPAFGGEEAVVAWGRRGGPDGTNNGFHQGDHTAFGANGHWGGVHDTPWGNGADDIDATIGVWANLTWTYDSATNTQTNYIDGVHSVTEVYGTPLNTHDEGLFFSLGSENETNQANTPIAFSGTIARVQVYNTLLSDAEVLAAYNDEAVFFETGVRIPEPGTFVLAVLGLIGVVSSYRRRRSR